MVSKTRERHGMIGSRPKIYFTRREQLFVNLAMLGIYIALAGMVTLAIFLGHHPGPLF